MADAREVYVALVLSKALDALKAGDFFTAGSRHARATRRAFEIEDCEIFERADQLCSAVSEAGFYLQIKAREP